MKTKTTVRYFTAKPRLVIRHYHRCLNSGHPKWCLRGYHGVAFYEDDQCELFEQVFGVIYRAVRYYTCTTTGANIGVAPVPFRLPTQNLQEPLCES